MLNKKVSYQRILFKNNNCACTKIWNPFKKDDGDNNSISLTRRDKYSYKYNIFPIVVI